MKKKIRAITFCFIIFASAAVGLGESSAEIMSLTVSMEEPNTHYYHVVFNCEGIKGDTMDFKMPAWSPGYYRVLNFAQNVSNFEAEDGDGKKIAWEKKGENIWQVKSAETSSIVLNYDMRARGRGVAESNLDEKKGYISPTGVFMYVDGGIQHPVSVTIKPYEKFKKISTGLEPVKGKENTFTAANFDILYDCPIYVGNQEVIAFEIDGIPYKLAVDGTDDFNRETAVSVLKRIVEAATGVVGEVPYKHYTFIMMGEGMGGLEHQNSMAVFTSMPKGDDPNDYKRWLAFISHEFFHLYNVKAIRPIALGPFDYDKENPTNMLWFSEGGTVYYEYIILNRAGLMGRNEVLNTLGRTIRKYENSAGNKIQTVAQASYNTWTEPFFGSKDTISYYDKGSALSMLLDLKIRHETQNKKSLDDVMKSLYKKYYKGLKRGFTDEEFEQACEETAGSSLSEFFEYVYTTKAIDYAKYLGYAGLEIETTGDEPEQGSFEIKPIPNPDALQSEILNSWLKE